MWLALLLFRLVKTYIVCQSLLGDHVEHGAILDVDAGHGVQVRSVVDFKGGI